LQVAIPDQNLRPADHHQDLPIGTHHPAWVFDAQLPAVGTHESSLASHAVGALDSQHVRNSLRIVPEPNVMESDSGILQTPKPDDGAIYGKLTRIV
jgi:hypothetical protein